jgi:hypothetical protein
MYEELYMKQCLGIHKKAVPTQILEKLNYKVSLANCITVDKVVHNHCHKSVVERLYTEINKK